MKEADNSMNQSQVSDSNDELDWIQLRQDIGAEALKNEESLRDKFQVCLICIMRITDLIL